MNLLELNHVEKSFENLSVLKDISISIGEGEIVSIIGPSGSGKSTFLRSLNLLEEPTDGEIIFNGVDITKKKYVDASGKKVKLDIDSLRQKMGLVSNTASTQQQAFRAKRVSV